MYRVNGSDVNTDDESDLRRCTALSPKLPYKGVMIIRRQFVLV